MCPRPHIKRDGIKKKKLKMLNTDIGVKLLSKDAKKPEKQTKQSAGYDLYSAEPLIILKQSRCLCGTHIALEIPKGFYGKIFSRSSLAVKGIDVGAGVIDSDYRGEILVLLVNNSTTKDFTIKKGDRIAQIIFHKSPNFKMVLVNKLRETERGIGGFGSTGKH
jgi:dUTP pyrophosphatase